jgi:hypothetical protein
MQRVIYEWGETGLRVERHCVSVDRVNDDNLKAQAPRSSCDLGESMKKQTGSEPRSLACLIDRQPCQQDSRHRVLPPSSAVRSGCLVEI